MTEYAEYKLTGDELTPAIVTLGEKSTPVWSQQNWEGGEYKHYVIHNGCGHCCATMALNLYGVKIDPHDEYSLCRELWGTARRDEGFSQGNYQSVAGITKILRHHGVPAEYFGVPDTESAEKHIEESLKAGKQVIFWSQPTGKFPDNPFSKGAHYVMAVGYTKENKILIANSSAVAAKDGVQLVDIDIIVRALLLGSAPLDITWGVDNFKDCAGYVVVG